MTTWIVYEDKAFSGWGLSKHGNYFISKGELDNKCLRKIKIISSLKDLRKLPTVLRSNALVHAVIPDPKFNNRSFSVCHALNRLTRQIDKTNARRK